MAVLYYYIRKHDDNKMYSSLKTWRVIISVLFYQGTVHSYCSVISLSTVSYFSTDQNKHDYHVLNLLIHIVKYIIHISQYLIAVKLFKCLVLHDFDNRSACASSIKAPWLWSSLWPLENQGSKSLRTLGHHQHLNELFFSPLSTFL